LLLTKGLEEIQLIEEIWEIMKGLSVVPCKGKNCLAICHVWLDALLARIAPYKQPATKNRQTVFPAHQRNEEAQVFIFQLFFKFP